MNAMLKCGTHGEQPETYVCKHIVQAMKTGNETGFYWSIEDGVYDAVCEKCNAMSDAKWQNRQTDLVRTLCLGCFKVAANHNGVDVEEVA
ncbi:MAG: hypothetical protein COA84_02070 [Robiginitomaculum sp.]|nr:MAG: hypothetical protein COA84_02070 [Robiginitomaculum sp.]